MKGIRSIACAGMLIFPPLICAAVDQPPEVADAKSVVVGRYFGFQSTNGVQITVNGKSYMTPLGAAQQGNGLPWADKMDYLSTNRYFATADCTGQAYAATYPQQGSEFVFGTRFGFVQIMDTGRVLFLPAAEKVQFLDLPSILESDGACHPTGGFNSPFAALSAPVDITSSYTRPFHIAGPKSGVSAKPFEAEDAKGSRIGRASGSQYAWQVQLTVSGVVYMVNLAGAIQADGLVSVSRLDYEADHPYFTTRDCSGTAYLRSMGGLGGFGAPFGMVFPKNSGQVLFFPGTSNWQDLSALSQLNADGQCVGADDGESGYAALGAPVDITNLFRRPFTIR